MIRKNLPIELSNSGLWVDATGTSIQFFCQKDKAEPVEVPLSAVDLQRGQFTHERSECASRTSLLISDSVRQNPKATGYGRPDMVGTELAQVDTPQTRVVAVRSHR